MPNEYDQKVEWALRNVRELLLANATPPRSLPDDRTASTIRAIAGEPELGRALERANDTALCFVLRELRHILEDKLQPRVLITRVWQIMDAPEVNRAFGVKENPRRVGWWKKPPTR